MLVASRVKSAPFSRLLNGFHGQIRHGGDILSAKGTPVFCPSGPWTGFVQSLLPIVTRLVSTAIFCSVVLGNFALQAFRRMSGSAMISYLIVRRPLMGNLLLQRRASARSRAAMNRGRQVRAMGRSC
jgi:hypothetical protein